MKYDTYFCTLHITKPVNNLFFLTLRCNLRIEGRNLIREFIYKSLEVLRNFISEVELHNFFLQIVRLFANDFVLLQMLRKTIPTFASFYSHLWLHNGEFSCTALGPHRLQGYQKFTLFRFIFHHVGRNWVFAVFQMVMLDTQRCWSSIVMLISLLNRCTK